MDDLFIEETEFTPLIEFNAQKRSFRISGISRPEDIKDFYSSALEWLENFENQILNHSGARYDTRAIYLEFNMVYFNSASSKALLQILTFFKRFRDKG